MSGFNWTIKCILFGAKIINLVREGKDQEALQEIKKLSPNLGIDNANYLLTRLKELA